MINYKYVKNKFNVKCPQYTLPNKLTMLSLGDKFRETGRQEEQK